MTELDLAFGSAAASKFTQITLLWQGGPAPAGSEPGGLVEAGEVAEAGGPARVWPAKAIHTMSSVSEPYGSPARICFCSTSKPCTCAFAPHLCHASIARKNLLLPWWREVVSLRDV